MKYLLTFTVLLFFTLCACNEDYIANNNIQSNYGEPVWPQYGYDARHSGNINALKPYMKPVEQGQEDWIYNFQDFGGDGSEITIDTKGNIYFLNQTLTGRLYKISPEGNIIWYIDTVAAFNYFGMALSADEKRIYFAAYRGPYPSGLCCIDSSGKFLWVNNTVSPDACRPVIGRNSNIYVRDMAKIHCVDANGITIWNISNNGDYSYSETAVDRDNNIYVSGRNIKKIDVNGNVLWTYSPVQADFLTQGIVIDANNNIYFTTSFSRQPHNLYSLTSNGNLRWQKDSNYTFIPAINADNVIYCGGRGITALDTSGNVLWNRPALGIPNYRMAESPVLDDESNIYYLVDGDKKQAGSFDRNGNLRWNYTAAFSTATLPGPALSPMGYLVFGPKRSSRLTSVK